jgi:Uma2 family endonuclease
MRSGTLTSEPAEMRVVLDNVSWTTFETLLDETGPRRGRMAYEEGTLEIMSPSPEHEILNSTIGILVEAYAQEMRIDMQATGSTTLKRQMKKRGVEPDKSYYFQNEALVRGRRDLELGRDPPPDLVIEIQITRSALDKLGICAAMGVPEVWLWEGDTLKAYWLGENNQYVESERSKALPGLPLATLLRFVERSKEKSTTRLANEFREWVRESVRKSG